MLLMATICVALVLTLLLPIYPEGLEASVLLFLALAGAAAVLALTNRIARRELVVLSLWMLAVLLAVLVGSVRHADAQQVGEDVLPYGLFVLGLLAGRAARDPRRVLYLVMLVCLADSVVSLVNMMPEYTPGFRSSYTYRRIVAGLPLLGMFAVVFLRKLDEGNPSSILRRSRVSLLVYAVMFVAMVASVSRGMMFGWVAGVTMAAYLRKPSSALLGAIIVTMAFVAYSSVFEDIGATYLRMGQASTIDGRFEEVRTALETFAQHPVLGSGLGASVEQDGRFQTYVHNIIAYHLWKFGLFGSLMLSIPLAIVASQLRRYPRHLRAAVLGGATAIFTYLVTCAVYKTYYLVWMYGLTGGAILSALWRWHIRHEPSSPALAQLAE